MSQKYFGLMTDYGLSKFRAVLQGTGSLTLSHMAFGDGNGAETAPSSSATALVNERYRAALTDKRPHETNPSIVYVEAVIPPGVGGWTLREAGIYDSEGGLIAIARTPVMDVALLAEGASTEGLVRLPIVFESARDVQFFVDPTVLLATQAWTIERILHRPFITVESATLKTPPVSPADFSLYVVQPGATGAWAGKDGQMAHWHGAWQFAQAPVAKVVGASDTGQYWRRTATGWAEFRGDETSPGFMQFASDAEHRAGTRSDRATHPAGLAAHVQAGSWISADDISKVANQIVINPAPAVTAYARYQTFRIRLANMITGPATVKIGSLPEVPLVRCDGSGTQSGDGYAGGIIQVTHDGTSFQLAALPPVLSAIDTALTFYVRPDGNDSNTGLANTASAAFKTLQGAVNAISSRYITKGGVTVNVAAGTYAGVTIKTSFVSSWQIRGNAASPASVVISSPTVDVNSGRSFLVFGANVTVSGFSFQSILENAHLSGGSLTFAGANIVTLTPNAPAIANSGGALRLSGTVTVKGAGHAFLLGGYGSNTMIGYSDPASSSPLALVYSSASFSVANIVASTSGTITVYPSAVSISGTATGQRYFVGDLGTINTQGSGINYFPGSVAGGKTSLGVYS